MDDDRIYPNSKKNPFLVLILLLILITIPLTILLLSQSADIRNRASEVTGFNKGQRYEVVSDLPDQYPIKVTKNNLDQFFTDMGLFKPNGVFDLNTGKPATVKKVIVHLTQNPQPFNKWTEGQNILESNGSLITGDTLNIYIYVSPKLLSYNQSFRSSRFYSSLLEAVSDLTTSPNSRNLNAISHNSILPGIISKLVTRTQNGLPDYTIQILNK